MLYAIIAILLIIADQVVKVLVRTHIPLGDTLPLLPGVMELTYIQNTGAAFSLFRDHTWILAIISAVAAVAIVVVLVKKVVSHPFGVISLAVVLGGAVGNLIDRVFFGFVTDMFQTVFINFAVFNVADICVVLGGIATCIYLLFCYEKYEKKGNHHDSTATDG